MKTTFPRFPFLLLSICLGNEFSFHLLLTFNTISLIKTHSWSTPSPAGLFLCVVLFVGRLAEEWDLKMVFLLILLTPFCLDPICGPSIFSISLTNNLGSRARHIFCLLVSFGPDPRYDLFMKRENTCVF